MKEPAEFDAFHIRKALTESKNNILIEIFTNKDSLQITKAKIMFERG